MKLVKYAYTSFLCGLATIDLYQTIPTPKANTPMEITGEAVNMMADSMYQSVNLVKDKINERQEV